MRRNLCRSQIVATAHSAAELRRELMIVSSEEGRSRSGAPTTMVYSWHGGASVAGRWSGAGAG
jgi:hypothetical protein